MRVDPSALLAMVFAENDGNHFATRLAGEPDCRISAIGYLEAAVRLDQLLGRVDPRLELFCK